MQLEYLFRNPLTLILDKIPNLIKGIFDMREEWVNEIRDKKKATATKVSTDKNIVDMMTKCLSA